jgi:hypothetical protein
MLEISKIKSISTLIPTIIVAKQSTKSSHLHLIYDGAIPFFFSNCKELFFINYVWIWDEFQIFALSSKNDKIDNLSMNPNLFQFLQKIDLQQNILNYQTNKKIIIKKSTTSDILTIKPEILNITKVTLSPGIGTYII